MVLFVVAENIKCKFETFGMKEITISKLFVFNILVHVAVTNETNQPNAAFWPFANQTYDIRRSRAVWKLIETAQSSVSQKQGAVAETMVSIFLK